MGTSKCAKQATIQINKINNYSVRRFTRNSIGCKTDQISGRTQLGNRRLVPATNVKGTR